MSASVGVTYEVMWQRSAHEECPYDDHGGAVIPNGAFTYEITNLQEKSAYSVSVSVTNAAGTSTSNTVTTMTSDFIAG